MGVGNVSREQRLTKEQEAIRLRGLRILARMIVRAHLASHSKDDAEKNGSGSVDGVESISTPHGDLTPKEGKSVR